MVLKERQPYDPDDMPVECEIEGCGKVVRRGDAVSYHVYIAMPGKLRVPATHCDDVQHFTCSPEHALIAADYCLREHLHPKLLTIHGSDAKQDTEPQSPNV